MNTTSAVLWGAVIAFLGLLVLAPGAEADTYCVAPATGCMHSEATLAGALNAAALSGVANTIKLGAATYEEDGLTYEGAGELTIEGAGPEATTIQRETAGIPVLKLHSAAPVNLSGVRIHEAGGTNLDGVFASGFGGGTLSHIKIDVAAGSTNSENLELAGGSWTLIDSTIEASDGFCVYTTAAGAQMTDDTLRGCSETGIFSSSETLVAARMRVSGAKFGIDFAGGQGRLEDSLFTGVEYGVAALFSGDGELLAKQDTFVGSGVGAECFNHAVATPGGSLTVEDSIIRDFPVSLKSDAVPGQPCPLTAKYTAFDGEKKLEGGGIVSEEHIFTGDPLFIDPGAGNYRLAAASPVIDFDTRPLEAGESATDLDHGLRIVGGGRDLGAYERPLPESAAGGGVDSITTSGARVLGTLDTGGAVGSWSLRYGTSGAYGAETPVTALAAATGGQPVSVMLSGLAEATTYHYQFLLTTPYGTFASPDATFATQSSASSNPAPPASAGPTGPGVQFKPAKAGRIVRVRKGRALVKLTCPSDSTCTGVVKLVATVRTRRHAAHHGARGRAGKRVRHVLIGKRLFSVPVARTRTVAIKLKPVGKRLVKAAGKRGLKNVRLAGSGVSGRSVVLKPVR